MAATKTAEKKSKPRPKSEPAPVQAHSAHTVASPEEAIAAAHKQAYNNEHPQKAFEHFRPLAEKVSTADLSVFTGEPLVMRANIKTAFDILAPHLTKAVARLHTPNLHEIFELPSLVMGLSYAATRVPTTKLSEGEIDRMLAEGAPWREMMFLYLRAVSHPFLNLVPAERVNGIIEGKGKLDKAQDFVALAGVFAEFQERLKGKHPFPEDKLDLLSSLGGALVLSMRSGRAPKEAPKRTPESILRDQMASLVVDRYDDLQVIAAVALGKRRADELLPALRSTAGLSLSSDDAEPVEDAADATASPAAPAQKPA